VISLTLIWDICHTGVWALGDKLRERFRRGLMVQKGAQESQAGIARSEPEPRDTRSLQRPPDRDLVMHPID
jgi:hypothetical protein